jgi:formylglycine-generating enzyme required for sulfatase activity/predicted Ser/Thr protein kinase
MPLAPGANFGPYRVIEPLGRGGMASVFKAYEPGLDRYVALKVLPPEFLKAPDSAPRFTREAKVIARLEHKDIVPIYNFGIDEGVPWMAMRLVGGGSLAAALQAGRMSSARTVQVLRSVAEALDYAHGEGVVHRDVKPQNILLDDDGEVYLADFGIARIAEASSAITTTGMVTGTPQYMAPEQALAQEGVDHRADIYALGVVAYEMFTGAVPFSADTPLAVMMKHVRDPIPLPPLQHVPEPLRRALLRALAKAPDDRWPTATAIVAALQVAALQKGITEDVPAITAHALTPIDGEALSEPPPLPRPARKRGGATALTLAFGCAIVTLGAALILGSVLYYAPWEHEAAAGPVVNPKDGLEYVRIPAGRFQMGCVPEDIQCLDEEKPRHLAEITRPFWIGRTEVTVDAFRRFSDQAGYRTAAERDGWVNTWDGTQWVQWPGMSWRLPGYDQANDWPAVYLTYDDAKAFCAWSGGRLPTEAEWEYAARGGEDGKKYTWGNAVPPIVDNRKQGNFADEAAKRLWPAWVTVVGYDDGYAYTAPVKTYAPNGYGLYDMAGNAWEWCADWYDPAYYGKAARVNPTGPAQGDARVMRSGAWNNELRFARVSYRFKMDPTFKYTSLGVRCARDR